jgi:hypothetical protein
MFSAREYRTLAEKCSRLADGLSYGVDRDRLLQLEREYRIAAEAVERRAEPGSVLLRRGAA